MHCSLKKNVTQYLQVFFVFYTIAMIRITFNLILSTFLK